MKKWNEIDLEEAAQAFFGGCILVALLLSLAGLAGLVRWVWGLGC